MTRCRAEGSMVPGRDRRPELTPDYWYANPAPARARAHRRQSFRRFLPACRRPAGLLHQRQSGRPAGRDRGGQPRLRRRRASSLDSLGSDRARADKPLQRHPDKATAAMRQGDRRTEVGDEQRGLDPTTRALEERVAELLGHEAAVFLAQRDDVQRDRLPPSRPSRWRRGVAGSLFASGQLRSRGSCAAGRSDDPDASTATAAFSPRNSSKRRFASDGGPPRAAIETGVRRADPRTVAGGECGR